MASRREIRTIKRFQTGEGRSEGRGNIRSFSVIVKLCRGWFPALVPSVHSVHSWHNNTHLWRLHLQSTQSQEEPPHHPSQVEKVVWSVCWGECEDIVFRTNLRKPPTSHSSPTENTFTLGPIVPTRSPLQAIAASQTLEYLVSFYLCFRDLRDPREYKNSSQGHGDEMWVAVVRTPVILWSD